MNSNHVGRERVQQMMGGPAVASLLYVAVELGLPEVLAARPATPDEVAVKIGGHPDAIHRILRVLNGFGVVSADAGGRYELTPTGALLRKDVPGSMYRAVRLLGHPEIQRAWTGLSHTAVTGGAAFDHVHGRDFMAYLADDPDLADRFNEFMASVTEGVAGIVAASLDIEGTKTIVDVGGGAGALVREVLQVHPQTTGAIVDVAELQKQAEGAIEADGLTARCSFHVGDFFTEVPGGADIYLLKSVLHDWDDDRCVDILTTCRAAMGDHSRLLIVERGMPEADPAPLDSLISDFTMLTMTSGGRERTTEEYRALIGRAGLTLQRVTDIKGGPHIIEATKG
jgi:hypothetical protein